MHDYHEQRADTFESFSRLPRGMKLPKTAVVIYEFVAEDVDTRWAEVEKALRAKGFRACSRGRSVIS